MLGGRVSHAQIETGALLSGKEVLDNPSSQAFVKEQVLQLVGHIFQVRRSDLLLKRRGQAHIAFARQAAMYLIHVVGGVNLSDVGRLLGRDRTTVAHACQCIEDQRDNPCLDWALDLMAFSLQCGGALSQGPHTEVLQWAK